ncbi:hypothetical protein ACWGI9_10545 [Streptomyces sp. NPDC054833]
MDDLLPVNDRQILIASCDDEPHFLVAEAAGCRCVLSRKRISAADDHAL